MKSNLIAAAAISGVILSGCATVFDGTSQDITVVTSPAGASCVFDRQGTTIATIANTPATVNVPKRKYDIMIRCDKPGYQTASYLNHSGVTALIAGNIAADLVLTGGLSSVVDSADGADNKYDSAVNMTLIPFQPYQAPVASAFPAQVGVQPQNQPPVRQEIPASVVSAPVMVPTGFRQCSEREKADDDELASLAREKGYQYRPRCR